MEIIWRLLDYDDQPITGVGPSTTLIIRRASDGYLLDWDDMSFKNSGWAALTSPFTEIDQTNLPGVYKKTIDSSGWQGGFYLAISAYVGLPLRRGEVEFWVTGAQVSALPLLWNLIDEDGDPITGASPWVKIRRAVDGFLFDWDDGSFKDSGWTTLAGILSEIDATNLAGLYGRVQAVASWDDGVYQMISGYTGPPPRWGESEVSIVDGAIVVESADPIYIRVPGEGMVVEFESMPLVEIDMTTPSLEVEMELL